jgi:hypothetical protein
VAGKTRDTDKPAREQASHRKAETGENTAAAEDLHPQGPAAERFAGRRSATIDLPFVTAQFRMPDMRTPSREELEAAARGVRSMMPSRKSMLFYGGLALSAAAGVIQWPVATAIGVGNALASRAAAPKPGDGTPQETDQQG